MNMAELKYRYEFFMYKNKKKLLLSILIILVVLAVLSIMLVLTKEKTIIKFDISSNTQAQNQSTQTNIPAPQPCSGISIEITGMEVSNGLARVIIRNAGINSTKLKSVVFYDTSNNAIPTDIALVRTYKPGDTDAFTFSDARISCAAYSGVVVEPVCTQASVTYTGEPTGC
jgi:hypothetical protein